MSISPIRAINPPIMDGSTFSSMTIFVRPIFPRRLEIVSLSSFLKGPLTSLSPGQCHDEHPTKQVLLTISLGKPKESLLTRRRARLKTRGSISPNCFFRGSFFASKGSLGLCRKAMRSSWIVNSAIFFKPSCQLSSSFFSKANSKAAWAYHFPELILGISHSILLLPNLILRLHSGQPAEVCSELTLDGASLLA